MGLLIDLFVDMHLICIVSRVLIDLMNDAPKRIGTLLLMEKWCYLVYK